MRRSPGPKWIISLAILCLVLFVIFYKPAATRAKNIISGVSSWAMTPFSALSRGLTMAGKTTGEAIGALREVRRLHSIEERLLTVEAENAMLREANRALQKALEVRAATKQKAVVADIMGSFYEGRDEFLIIREPSEVISESAVVLTSEGTLVGVVRSASTKTATVRLMMSPSETMTVSLSPSGVNGVLRGDNNGEYLITLVSKDASISVGDAVIAAGRNSGIPPGTPVGTVVNVTGSPTDSFLQIRAKAPFDVSTLSQVVVLYE